MLKVFLVFYTATGGIASVSRAIPDMEWCETIADEQNERNLGEANSDADVFVAECERHKSRPKITVKIDPKRRKTLEVSCIARGLPMQCSDLPNGDVEFMTSGRDKHGNRLHVITRPDGSSVTGTYDSKGRFHIIREEDLERGHY
jgi:hypothetical protein